MTSGDTSDTRASTLAASVRSVHRVSTPAGNSASAWRCAVAATRQPSAANRRTVSRPTRPKAPVTSTVSDMGVPDRTKCTIHKKSNLPTGELLPIPERTLPTASRSRVHRRRAAGLQRLEREPSCRACRFEMFQVEVEPPGEDTWQPLKAFADFGLTEAQCQQHPHGLLAVADRQYYEVVFLELLPAVIEREVAFWTDRRAAVKCSPG